MAKRTLLESSYTKHVSNEIKKDVPVEVLTSPLSQYSDEALEGRLRHYESEAIFERNARLREVWKKEVERTKHEILARKARLRQEAERAFKQAAE